MCDAVQQDLCVCRPWPINHSGNKIWKCQTHNSSCKKSQGSASTFLMCHYLCVSSCCKNKARMCANNRNKRLSVGKPQGSISCWHSVICFHFPFSVSVVHLISVTAPVSIVSEQWLKVGFENERVCFGVFLFCPPDPPWGPPWSLSHSSAAHESTQEKTWLSDPQSPLLFLPSKSVCPVDTPFENKTISCFAKSAVPKMHCSQGVVISMDASFYMRMFCS